MLRNVIVGELPHTFKIKWTLDGFLTSSRLSPGGNVLFRTIVQNLGWRWTGRGDTSDRKSVYYVDIPHVPNSLTRTQLMESIATILRTEKTAEH